MVLHILRNAAAMFVLTGTLAVAQTNAHELAPAVRQRVETLLRSRVEFPPATTITFTLTGPGELPGFDRLKAHFASTFAGSSGDLSLLISRDGLQLAQLSTFDLAADPLSKVPFSERPSRGGPETAPVILVSFDDLQCPFCARLHSTLFPALTDHYKDQIRIVYQSLPSDGHPWAMHAAIDTDCLASLSVPAFWAAVDHIHAHAAEYGGTERKLAVATQQIDADALEQGKHFGLDAATLKACLKKQDPAQEKASIALAASLGVHTTPTVFVNGAKFAGAVPIDFVFDMVDNALRAEGQKVPPRPQPSIQPEEDRPTK